MDKSRAAAIAATAARAEQIKANSAEYLWVCRGGKPSAAAAPSEPRRAGNEATTMQKLNHRSGERFSMDREVMRRHHLESKAARSNWRQVTCGTARPRS